MITYVDEHGGTHQKPKDIPPVRRLSAYALVQSEDGKILMVQPVWNNLWELPGGGIEVEESIKAGLVREFLEETGYTISVDDQPISLVERNFFHAASNTYINAINLVYRGKVEMPPAATWKMHAVEEDKIAKIEWVHRSLLTEANTHPRNWHAISGVSLS